MNEINDFKKDLLYNSTNLALSQSIELLSGIKEIHPNLLKNLGKKAYLDEFCTIQLKLPRQCGLSTISGKICEIYFKNAVYVTRINSQKDCFCKLTGIDKNKVFTVNDLLNKLRGRKIDAIVVDSATYIGAGNLQIIKELALVYIESGISLILLG